MIFCLDSESTNTRLLPSLNKKSTIQQNFKENISNHRFTALNNRIELPKAANGEALSLSWQSRDSESSFNSSVNTSGTITELLLSATPTTRKWIPCDLMYSN